MALSDKWTSGIGNAVGSFSNFFLGLLKLKSDKKIAEDNLQMQKDTNAQNESLMREGWARDDQSRQRMVSDLESAGLSKWLATGASPMSSSPIQLSAPQNQYKADYSMMADAMAHAYNNFMQGVQTIKQNKILDKQAEVISEDLAIKQAEKRIKEHDANVFENRPDTASTDPATLKYVSEVIKALKGEREVGNLPKMDPTVLGWLEEQQNSGSIMDQIKAKAEEEKQKTLEKIRSKQEELEKGRQEYLKKRQEIKKTKEEEKKAKEEGKSYTDFYGPGHHKK